VEGYPFEPVLKDTFDFTLGRLRLSLHAFNVFLKSLSDAVVDILRNGLGPITLPHEVFLLILRDCPADSFVLQKVTIFYEGALPEVIHMHDGLLGLLVVGDSHIEVVLGDEAALSDVEPLLLSVLEQQLGAIDQELRTELVQSQEPNCFSRIPQFLILDNEKEKHLKVFPPSLMGVCVHSEVAQ